MNYRKLGEVAKTTSDSRTYKRAIKWMREVSGEINCSRCGYHRGCNHNNKTFKQKGWKECSKRKTQYKPI